MEILGLNLDIQTLFLCMEEMESDVSAFKIHSLMTQQDIDTDSFDNLFEKHLLETFLSI